MTAAKQLSELGNERIKDGGNMSPFDAVTSDIDDHYDEAKNWASDGFEIASQEQADAIGELDKKLLKLGQDADALRVAENKPFDDGKAAVQAKFNPFIQKGKGKVDMGRASLKALLTPWRVEQKRIKDAEAQRIRDEKEAAEVAAQQAFQQSNVADLEQREEAEAMAARADELARAAKKADKAATTKTGLRTSYEAELTNLSAAIQHYWTTERDEFVDLVQRLADRDTRNGSRKISGFKIIEVKKA